MFICTYSATWLPLFRLIDTSNSFLFIPPLSHDIGMEFMEFFYYCLTETYLVILPYVAQLYRLKGMIWFYACISFSSFFVSYLLFTSLNLYMDS